jgi:pimeloyl-ACP methyl ester carboxylesterase
MVKIMMNICVIVFLLSEICQAQKIHTDDLKKLSTHKEIHFTVRINLNFPDYNSRALALADSDSIYYDQAILRLPENYSDTGTPVRLVYLAHGAGGGVTDITWAWNKYSIIDSLLENGYACFDVNGGPSVENMGGIWVVQSAFKAYEKIRNNYNVDDKIFVIGGSMGGLSSTNFVYKHSNLVLAHGLLSPVLDLYDQAWANPWYPTTKQSIAKAFNFTDQSGSKWEPDKIIGWNPCDINTFWHGKDTFKIYPVPVIIWHGIDDPVVKISTSKKFQRHIHNAGGYCELRELDSDSHGLSCGDAFINRELLLFLSRFDN